MYDEISQDVNNEGIDQPAEDTSSQSNGDNKKDAPDLDNKIKELERKLGKMDDNNNFYKDEIARQREIINHFKSQQHPQAQEAQPEVTDDELWNILSTGEQDHVKIARKELERRMGERITQNILPKVETKASRQMWEQKALSEFPELADRTGSFFKQVQQEYKLLNPQLPNIVYLAAKNAYSKNSTNKKIIKNENIPQNPGYSRQGHNDKNKDDDFVFSEKSKYMTKFFNNSDDKEYEKRVKEQLKDIKRQKALRRGGNL